MSFLIVFIGGVIGAACRFLVTVVAPSGLVLWLINGFGSFLMGLLQGYFMHRQQTQWKLFFTTGVLGAFTTFSAFSAEWFNLMDHSMMLGVIYAVAMTVLCIVLSSCGYLIMKKKVAR